MSLSIPRRPHQAKEKRGQKAGDMKWEWEKDRDEGGTINFSPIHKIKREKLIRLLPVVPEVL